MFHLQLLSFPVFLFILINNKLIQQQLKANSNGKLNIHVEVSFFTDKCMEILVKGRK